MVVARREVVVLRERDRRPELDFGKVVEERHPARHHARDRVSLTAEPDLTADDILIAAKPSLPQFVAQQHDAMTPELLFFVRKQPAEGRCDLQYLKEIRSDICTLNALGRLVLGREVEVAVIRSEERRV